MSLTALPIAPLFATSRSSETFVNKYGKYDFAIGGLPFLNGISKRSSAEWETHYYQRSTAEYRKQQIDQTSESGEQTLSFWWSRAQSSFHAGAGQKFFDSASAIASQFRTLRFLNSTGVDVFSVPGAASLLPTTSLDLASTANALADVVALVDGSTNCYVSGTSTTALTRRTPGGTSTPITTYTGGVVSSLCGDGSNWYAGGAAGIWKGPASGASATLIYTTASGATAVKWCKQRLMAAVGQSIYELDANAGASTALPAAKYTHKNANWRWTDIAEGQDAIFVSGYAGGNSAIFRFSLDTTGAVPVLTTGFEVAPLPRGEYVASMFSYLGKFLVLGTNKGVRVAEFLLSGQLGIGPLLFPSALPVECITARGNFIFVGWTDPDYPTGAGLACIDLGTEIEPLRFAYSSHLVAAGVTGSVVGCDVVGGKLVFHISGSGTWLEGTTLLASGTLVTSRIRYGTLDQKLVRGLRVRTDGSGSVGAYVGRNVDSGQAFQGTVQASAGSNDELDVDIGPMDFCTVAFILMQASPTVGPVLSGYTLKALPATKRQRVEQIPLLCYDNEIDTAGNPLGGQGTAWSRLVALEAIEEAADIVTLQRLSGLVTDRTARLVVIEQIDFIQMDPPAGFGGFGGVIVLTTRTVQ